MQESVRKVPKNETAERLPQNRQGDAGEPADKKRAPRFPGLEDFLNQSPDDPSQASIINSPSSPSQPKRKSERKTQSPTLDLDGSERQDPPQLQKDFQKQFEDNFNQKPKGQDDLTNDPFQ